MIEIVVDWNQIGFIFVKMKHRVESRNLKEGDVEEGSAGNALQRAIRFPCKQICRAKKEICLTEKELWQNKTKKSAKVGEWSM